MEHYGMKELMQYGGFMLGTASVYKLLEQGGVEGHFTRLIAAVIAGLVIGWGLQRLYTSGEDKGPGKKP